MITYRTYESGDEQKIVKLWNECLPHDPITSERFRNLVLLDANFDPNGLQLAVRNDKLIGCVYALRRLLPMYKTDLEEDNGWIIFFFVAQQERNKNIGRELFSRAIQILQKAGRNNVFFASYAPNYILPGIDEVVYPEGYEFLLEQGFEKLYSPVAMDCQLVDFQLPTDVRKLRCAREAEGYTFSMAEDKDLYEVIQFANEIFNPDWGRAIREGILQGLPLKRILIVRSGKGKIVGFCVYGAYEGIPERFGPFGVDPDEQGKGLGKILLNECLQSMKAEGLHGAWFLWTGETSSAGHLYKSTGFRVTRKFHVMKKSI